MKPFIFALCTGLSQGAEYGYESLGNDWGHHFGMCARLDNSPINIQSASAIHDDSVCDSRLNWNVDWTVNSWSISNNGHSLAVVPVAPMEEGLLPGESSMIDEFGTEYTTLTTEPNSIARLPNHFLPADSPHTEFCLHSFHFHWGSEDSVGSEHVLDDFSFPLEVHFVHYSCKRKNISAALGPYPNGDAIDSAKKSGNDPYELAVVGIFLEVKPWDNPAFEAILSQDVLNQVGVYPQDKTIITKSLELEDLIPEGVFTDGYFAYQGGLTTPPCTPIVRWHVSNAHSFVGEAQMERFRAMMSNNVTNMAPNYRDTVVNTNPVYACMDPEIKTRVQKNEVVEKKDISIKDEIIDNTETTSVWIWVVVVLVCVVVIACAFVYYIRLKQAEQARIEHHRRELLNNEAEIGRVEMQQYMD